MGKQHRSKNARTKGAVKRRRRKRAEHREKTRETREAINAKKRAERHPGWIHNPPGHPRWWPADWPW